MASLDSDANLDHATEIEGYKVLPPCVIYGKIGQGGMGAVYRGRHLNLDIDVAVKCLKPGLAGEDDQFVVRFRREARSAAQISHQNVIRVYDVAEDQGLHYLIMELVQGETARERVVRKKRLQVGEALEIVYGAALGLAEAHRKGFIHRDIKPDNIMVSSAGQVKLADLGLAKPLMRDDHASMLSGANLVMGTPQYMPPEQWENTTTVTPAADIWALGATLYYLLAGGEAIPKDSLPRIMQRIVLEPFPDVRKQRSDVPDEVAELIAKATRTAVAERFQNAQELASAIEMLQSRRQSLRDKDAAPSTQLNTLLSPPPPKTLAKIKFWLDEQGQKPNATDRLRATQGKQTASGGAGPTGTQSLSPVATTSTTFPGAQAVPPPRRGALVLGGLAVAIVAILLWLRPWQPGVDSGPFQLAAQLEASGKIAEAVAETARVYANDPSLTGKDARMARLHAAWAAEYARLAQFREALQQLGKSLAFVADPAVQRQKTDLLARVAGLLDSVFERTWPGGKPVPREAKTGFRGRLGNSLVAGLKLDGKAVARDPDGSFRTDLALDGRREVAVDVTLLDGEQVSLPAWNFDYEGPLTARPAVAMQVEPEVLELDDDKAAELRIRAARGVELRIDGVLVSRGSDETHVHRVRSDLEAPPPLVVTARQEGCEDTTRRVALRRVVRALEFVTPLAVLDARTLEDARIVTAQPTAQLQAQVNERAGAILVDGAPATDLQWRDDRVFTCTVALKEGRNDLRLEVQQRFRQPAVRQLTVFRLAAPRLVLAPPCKADDATGAANYELAVFTDEWTSSVTARSGPATVTLAKEAASTNFRGQIPLAAGANQIALEAVNVLDQRQTLTLRVDRTMAAARPTITSVANVAGTREQVLAAKGAGFVRRGGALRIVSSDPAAVILVNNVQVEVGSQGTVSLASYEQKDEAELTIVAKNAAGSSEPFRCRIYFDDVAPTIRVLAPDKPLGTAKSFVCSGTWADLRGLSSVTVGDKKAAITPAGGAAKEGRWSVQLDAPAASAELPIVAEDRAGNRTETKVRIDVGEAAPRTSSVLPRGFAAKGGAPENDLGFARVIVHAVTGIELKAVGFAAGRKPDFYAAVSEVTKREFTGDGPAEPCGDVTAIAVVEWLRAGRGGGLALPTPAEWDALVAAPAELGILGLRSGQAEWLEGKENEAEWPLRTATGEPTTLPRDRCQPVLGFRVVLRLP